MVVDLSWGLWMTIICNKCGEVINKDKYFGEKLIEEFKNIYGTKCPKCGIIIKTDHKPFFNENRDLKMAMLKCEMKEKMKKKMQGEKRCQ